MWLARDDRQNLVRLLADQVVSTRGIALTVGADHATVERDPRSPPVANATVVSRSGIGSDGRTLPVICAGL